MSSRHTSSRLRHRLTLQQEVRTPDGAGGYDKSWSDVADLWAEIVPVTGTLSKGAATQLLLGAQVQHEISHKILLRYRDGVTAAMRLVYESRIFHIRYVADAGENRETLQLLVMEGAAT